MREIEAEMKVEQAAVRGDITSVNRLYVDK